ncbi:sigma factor [Micromonospora sp. NPDC048063]|uniref:sigma factor n=1 Tax=Micromonospora sp. NPDC048063 TaxID=3364256 RepID=UPI003714CBE3
MDAATEAFVAHHNLLFTPAYEMLGSAVAEDVLQETWLLWVGVDLGTVLDQRAFLIRIATRQALKRLRTPGRRKESHAACPVCRQQISALWWRGAATVSACASPAVASNRSPR